MNFNKRLCMNVNDICSFVAEALFSSLVECVHAFACANCNREKKSELHEIMSIKFESIFAKGSLTSFTYKL